MAMVGSEKKEDSLLTGLPFQDRQAGYTTQTPGERGMQSARNGGDRESRRRSRRWMDVLESLNGMLIKGLGCGLGCKDQLQFHNVPLEMSAISAQAQRLSWPADAPCSTLAIGWLLRLNHFCNLLQTKQFHSHRPAVRLC